MAKAFKVTGAQVPKQRQRRVVTYETETYYEEQTLINLTLTEGEADCLLAVLCKVGGDRKDSPRKYVDRISEALKQAVGHDFRHTDAYPLLGSIRGLVFHNYGQPVNSDG